MKYQYGKKRKIESIYELPNWEMYEKFNLPHPEEMWEVEINLELEDDDPPIPDSFLIKFYVNALKGQRYENADVFKKELESRGFTITIEMDEKTNKGTVKFEKEDEWNEI